MRPNRSTVWATAAFTASETVTSQGKASTASPNSSARLASSSDGRARQATRIPAPTSAATKCRPIPFETLVTTATLPASLSIPNPQFPSVSRFFCRYVNFLPYSTPAVSINCEKQGKDRILRNDTDQVVQE